MPSASYMTNRGLQLLATVDFDAIDFRAALIITEVAAATGRAHNFLSEAIAAANEATCTGYARKTLAGIAVTETDGATNNVTVAFTSVAWGALGGAANCAIAQMVIYRQNAADAAAEIIAYVGAATGMPFTSNGSTVTSTTPTFTFTSTAT